MLLRTRTCQNKRTADISFLMVALQDFANVKDLKFLSYLYV